MPIYEYVCRDCERRFETLVRGAEQPQCPHCHGRQLDKQFSVFGVGGPSASDAPGPCGSCGDPRGPGACSLD
ncbi:MAG: zinc ribbon domain-containing protein [Planctomycetota bacterium]